MTGQVPVSSVTPSSTALLRKGADLLGQAHGPHVAKVVADDFAWHPAATAQAMAHLEFTDSRFRDTLAGNKLDPDGFGLVLHDAVKYPESYKTPFGQMAEIFA